MNTKISVSYKYDKINCNNDVVLILALDPLSVDIILKGIGNR